MPSSSLRYGGGRFLCPPHDVHGGLLQEERKVHQPLPLCLELCGGLPPHRRQPLHRDRERVLRRLGHGCLLGLVASSIIVIIASTDFLGPNSFHRYEAIYAMVVSCITLIVFVTFLLEERRKMNLRKTRGEHQGGYGTSIFKIVGLGLFAVLWVALAFVATFRGPFLTTGNGYFAVWAGAGCACSAATAARRKGRKND